MKFRFPFIKRQQVEEEAPKGAKVFPGIVVLDEEAPVKEEVHTTPIASAFLSVRAAENTNAANATFEGSEAAVYVNGEPVKGPFTLEAHSTIAPVTKEVTLPGGTKVSAAPANPKPAPAKLAPQRKSAQPAKKPVRKGKSA